MSDYNYRWFWRKRLPERKDQPCRVLARGRKNSILVQFVDGYKVITSRFAVRRIMGASEKKKRKRTLKRKKAEPVRDETNKRVKTPAGLRDVLNRME